MSEYVRVATCNECHSDITARVDPWGCAPAKVSSKASNCGKCKAWTCGPQCTFAHAHHTAPKEIAAPKRTRETVRA